MIKKRNNAVEVMPPSRPGLDFDFTRPMIFLAGSIEMDKAEEWQEYVTSKLEDHKVNIMNPRRNDWNSSWKQSIDDDNFRGQVNWELDYLDQSRWIIMYLQPGTMSPISMLELGLHARDLLTKLIVICPEGFWRKGNIDIVCDRFDIPQFDTLDEGIEYLKTKLP